MRLLAISEHYFPRIGGTVNYVHETLCALAATGVDAELLVPGPEPERWRPEGAETLPYRVTWIDAGYPASGDPGRDQRYTFCTRVNTLAKARLEDPASRPDLLHVLFGLFVMEVLETEALKAAGLPCIATVHNVPPMECRQVSHDAPLKARAKEEARLRLVGWKNRMRLRKHRFNAYVVPSGQVRDLLAPIVGSEIAVIGHGVTSDLQVLMEPPAERRPTNSLQILTAGGYAPHKRQHLIPETAERLRSAGLAFHWSVVGPSGRVRGYHAAIAADLARRSLEAQVSLHEAVPFATLAGLYDRANLYLQPSIEEGFCLTALDAAAAGLPVIGCRAGALPEIIETSGGMLVESKPASLASAIEKFMAEDRWRDAPTLAQDVRARFSWPRAAKALSAFYDAQIRKRAS